MPLVALVESIKSYSPDCSGLLSVLVTTQAGAQDIEHRQVEVSTSDGRTITYKSGRRIPLFFAVNAQLNGGRDFFVKKGPAGL